jgi:hypothetical protein
MQGAVAGRRGACDRRMLGDRRWTRASWPLAGTFSGTGGVIGLPHARCCLRVFLFLRGTARDRTRSWGCRPLGGRRLEGHAGRRTNLRDRQRSNWMTCARRVGGDLRLGVRCGAGGRRCGSDRSSLRHAWRRRLLQGCGDLGLGDRSVCRGERRLGRRRRFRAVRLDGNRGLARSRLDHRRVGSGRLRGRFRLYRNLHGRRGRRRGRSHRTDGQQAERVDVTLRLACHAHAEVHVWLRVAFGPDCSDDASLADEGAALDSDRAEVKEGRRVAERRLDRDRLSARRHRPGERHHAFGGGEHGRSDGRAQVDAPVLAAGVRGRVIEDERPQDGPVHGPGPGSGHGDR